MKRSIEEFEPKSVCGSVRLCTHCVFGHLERRSTNDATIDSINILSLPDADSVFTVLSLTRTTVHFLEKN